MRAEDKKTLRSRLLAERAALDPVFREQAGRSIAAHLMALPAFSQAQTVLCFLSTPQEVDTAPLLQGAFSAGKRVGVPVCLNRSEMCFYEIGPDTPLHPGRYGILEPDRQKCEPILNFSASICITPALCYDENGYRVGYGAGYYDRFFAGYPGVRAGIVYERYRALHFSHEETDLPVQYIVTEAGVYCMAGTAACCPEEGKLGR